MSRLDETSGDDWNEMAKIYKALTADTSAGPIATLLEKANSLLPFSEATGILDNGCGPGPIMSRLLRDYKIPESSALTCSDFSQGMINQVKSTKEETVKADAKSPWSRVEAVVQDAMNLESIADGSQSHVTAGWVYFMTPDPQKCLSESKRVLKDGGVLSCSSWEGSQWLDVMNMLPQVRPDKTMPEIPAAWKEVEAMKGELEKAGFKEVESHRVPTKMSYDSRETFLNFVLKKMPHMIALTKDMSEEEMGRLHSLMNEGLKKYSPDEPGTLTGVALVATGRK